MKITANGEIKEIPNKTTLSDYLEMTGIHNQKIAVEINLKIIEKELFKQTFLQDGDMLEIIGFVGGGGE